MPICSPKPIHICHVITGLGTGGAETALYRLLQRIDRERFTVSVVSLTDSGTFGQKIAELGVPVECLNLRAGVLPLRGVLDLSGHLTRTTPDIVQSWMYHANLLSTIAVRLRRLPIPVIWNIRHSVDDLEDETRGTRWVIQASRLLSGKAEGIVYNSVQARQQHEELGYQASEARCIPNGFDLIQPPLDKSVRAQIRQSLGIPLDVPVVGHIGRYHLMKDHAMFLKAIAFLRRSCPQAHFVMCGREVTLDNPELRALIEESDLPNLHLLGERSDVPRLLRAMDMVCSSSAFGEGFPNVLGEAMAAGLPCVTTDVGDSARIVGDTGFITPPRDSQALAEALGKLLQMGESERAELGQRARQRIEQNYSLSNAATAYQDLYRSVLETP